MDQKQPLNFRLRADVVVRRIFWCFLGIELLIVFLDVFVNHYEWSSIASIRRMVNITREDSLSNWFSSIQAIIVGSVIWLIAFAVRNRMHDNHYKRKFYCWACIGIFSFTWGLMMLLSSMNGWERPVKSFLRDLQGHQIPGFYILCTRHFQVIHGK